jgi:hypothetical protein
LALIAPDATIGYPVPQRPRLFEQRVSDDVRCVVTVETAIWKQDEPALIHIRVENLTDRDLDFETVPTLYLKDVWNTYWLPSDILRNKALDVKRRPLDKKAAAESIEPISLKVQRSGGLIRAEMRPFRKMSNDSLDGGTSASS